MEFITLLVALAFERWTPVGKLVRDFRLFDKYFNLFPRLFEKVKMPAWLNFLVILIPLLGVVGWLNFLFSSVLSGWFSLIDFLFSLIVLLYCLDSFSIVEPQDISEGLFGEEHERLVGSLLIQSNRNIFAVLFWFALLGPVGAVLYRLMDLMVQAETSLATLSPIVLVARQILDWIPVRLVGLGCALVSHFREVMAVWLKDFFTRFDNNEHFLTKCGLIALKHEPDSQSFSIEDMRELSEALVDRTLVLWLVIMALIILL